MNVVIPNIKDGVTSATFKVSIAQYWRVELDIQETHFYFTTLMEILEREGYDRVISVKIVGDYFGVTWNTNIAFICHH